MSNQHRNDADYLRERIAAEVRRAAIATDKRAREIHGEMAAIYERRLGMLGSDAGRDSV